MQSCWLRTKQAGQPAAAPQPERAVQLLPHAMLMREGEGEAAAQQQAQDPAPNPAAASQPGGGHQAVAAPSAAAAAGAGPSRTNPGGVAGAEEASASSRSHEAGSSHDAAGSSRAQEAGPAQLKRPSPADNSELLAKEEARLAGARAHLAQQQAELGAVVKQVRHCLLLLEVEFSVFEVSYLLHVWALKLLGCWCEPNAPLLRCAVHAHRCRIIM